MKTKKNRKQKAGFKFLTDMWNKGKEGWNKGTKSVADSSKGLFSSKPKTSPPPPITTPTTSAAPTPTSSSINQINPNPISNGNLEANTPSMQTSTTPIQQTYSNPSIPVTSGGRRRKNMSRHKKGGYNLANASPVSNEKVAAPTYWITGGKKRKSKKRKISKKRKSKRKPRKSKKRRKSKH